MALRALRRLSEGSEGVALTLVQAIPYNGSKRCQNFIDKIASYRGSVVCRIIR